MTFRIAHIIPTLDQGGAEKQLCLLATRLPREEFETHVIVLTRDGPYHDVLKAHDIPMHLVGKRNKLDVAAYRRLRATLRELAPDCVHTWLFAANSYGRRAAFAERVPHVLAAERCADHWKSRWHYWIDRRLAKLTDAIVTNSSGVRHFYAMHGLSSEKFVVIPNGIEPNEFTAADEETRNKARSDLRRTLGLPEHARLVGAVGRLWPQKNYESLLLAFQQLVSQRPDVNLLVAGDGPEGAFLKQRTLDLNLTDRVFWLGHRADVARLMAGLDVYWLGSDYEGQSNSLMEAMNQGLPVVVTDIPGNRDLVISEESGVLIRVGDYRLRADRTRQILDDPILARRLGNAACERMRRDFSVEQMVGRYADLYRRIASGPSLVKLPRGREESDA